jgi:hypothetical protein
LYRALAEREQRERQPAAMAEPAAYRLRRAKTLALAAIERAFPGPLAAKFSPT